ncbi:MAG: hypothetical protein ACXVLM_14925 [Ilumatobacteraceae bacterium]
MDGLLGRRFDWHPQLAMPLQSPDTVTSIPASSSPPSPPPGLVPPPPPRPHTPPSDDEPARHRNIARAIRRSVLVVGLLGLLAAIAIVVVQHRRDAGRFKTAHAAYLAGRCDDAVSSFDTLLGNGRWIDTAGVVEKAKAQRDECADLLAADALSTTEPSAALVAYATFVTGWPDTPLRDVVATRAAALIAQRGASGVASATTCARLTEVASAGVITATTVTEIKLECAVLYRDAGRADDAYDAALAVLRDAEDQQLVERAASLVIADPQMCAIFDEVRSLADLDRRPADLSVALQRCITAAVDNGDLLEAARLRLALLSALPADESATSAAEAMLASAESCTVLVDAQADAVVLTREGFVADLTFWCAQVAENSGQFDAAVQRYQWFVDNAPLDERAVAARDGLARALINQAQNSGAGTLPEPTQSGRSGGTLTDVVVFNDSPEELRLVLSGPESRIEIIPASPTSTTYSLVGPPVCRTDVPSLELQLQPGDYQTLVESTSGAVNPFVGTWSLAKGAAYRSCFFVVTSIG